MSASTASNHPKSGLALPLVLFIALMLLATILPTRERALLPFNSGDLVGFLAQSAADEQMPGPFGEGVEDPFDRSGSVAADRSAALLNPVLRSGGAARRTIGPRAPQTSIGTATGDLPATGDAPEIAALAAGPGAGGQAPGAGDSSPTDTGGGGFPFAPGGPGGLNLGLLVAVPEPATWLLMIFGFAGIGQVLRSRGKRGGVSAGRAGRPRS